MTEDIRKLPVVSPRVETGPVQFGDDWPGLFIRGDDAAGYRLAIEAVLHEKATVFDLEKLAVLYQQLVSCKV